ncbi:MAG TPA: SDR family oxidoreductase [Anaerolineales bacterium]|nr:SDR family oxidoreductase [Anaerolineales bacterium]
MKDKVVVITGSTRGYGYAIAEAVLEAGAAVVISGRSQEALTKALDSLEPHGIVKGQTCDVRNEEQVYALARFAVQSFGYIDVWINNAGYSSSAGLMLETHPHEAIDMFLANDMGTLYGAQAALHFMTKRGEGTLVNIYGNGSFLRPASPTGLYGATKAWVTSFTRSLAKEISGSGVKLIGFSPGMLLTDMLTHPVVIGERGKEMLKRYSFVLRLLAKDPREAARKLVETIATNQKDFLDIERCARGRSCSTSRACGGKT